MTQKIALIIAYTFFGISALAMIGFALIMVGYLFWSYSKIAAQFNIDKRTAIQVIQNKIWKEE